MSNVDKQYFKLIKTILKYGTKKNSRAGNVKSIFGYQMKFSLKKGLPILTTKKVFYKGILHELIWFLKGDTNIKYLVENNVHIWDDDAYRWYVTLVNKHNLLCKENKNEEDIINILNKEDFLNGILEERELILANNNDFFSKVLSSSNEAIVYKFGNVGNIYGKQWRSYGNSKLDQIQSIIETLKSNPDDRRMLSIAYNPDVLSEIALPPCHILFQVNTRLLTNKERYKLLYNHINIETDFNEWYHNEKGKKDNMLNELNIPTRELNLMWYQRSVDVGLGLPFNITSYSILLLILANMTNMVAGNVICSLGDCHIYLNQIKGIKKQMKNNPKEYAAPQLLINKKIEDINNITFNDFELKNYQSFDSIKLPLSVGLKK